MGAWGWGVGSGVFFFSLWEGSRGLEFLWVRVEGMGCRGEDLGLLVGQGAGVMACDIVREIELGCVSAVERIWHI